MSALVLPVRLRNMAGGYRAAALDAFGVVMRQGGEKLSLSQGLLKRGKGEPHRADAHGSPIAVRVVGLAFICNHPAVKIAPVASIRVTQCIGCASYRCNLPR